MTKNAETTVVDGPRTIRIRETTKGPGKVAVYAASQNDADLIVADLKADGNSDVIVTNFDVPMIFTHAEWKANTEADRALAIARKDALASIKPEIKALLGLKD